MSETLNEGGMTFDQAAAAIQDSVKTDPEFTPGLPADLPTQDQAADTPTPGDAAAAPDAEASTDFATPDVEESFMGGDFNPDLLPDELKPGFKQLQAQWTRKTQELAEQRKGLEGLGDPDELRTAHEFYTSLRDPEYLKNFYQELGSVVQEMGLIEAPADGEQPAQEQPQQPAIPGELQQLIDSDPELKPLAGTLSAMQQRLDQFEAQFAAREQALAEEQKMMADAYQIDQMVQAVREAHPNYNDSDWQAIYDRAHAVNGNVIEAAERYEADKARIISEWTAQKQATPASTPLPGAGTVAEASGEDLSDLSPKEVMDRADAAAQAFLAANDLTEFTG